MTTSGYSRTPRILKGALIELTEPFLGPVPNIIPFQYNPNQLVRKFTPWALPEDDDTESEADPFSQPFDPQEKITMTLELDATDALDQPDTNPIATAVGVADRIAAIEKLIYPSSTTGGLGGLADAVGSLIGADIVTRRQVPVVLLVWGPGRIVPVRITRFEITEEAFSPTLYPVMAKVVTDLRVLTPADFERPGHRLSLAEEIAVTSYKYTHAQKELLARAGLLSNLDSILGILPF